MIESVFEQGRAISWRKASDDHAVGQHKQDGSLRIALVQSATNERTL